MTTFYEITRNLTLATTKTAKSKFTKQLSKCLAYEGELSETVLRSIVINGIYTVSEMTEILDKKNFKIRFKTYIDDDGDAKIAFGLAFIQDHENDNPKLDGEVLFAVIEEIKNNNLDLIINDVAVNLIGLRNFS